MGLDCSNLIKKMFISLIARFRINRRRLGRHSMSITSFIYLIILPHLPRECRIVQQTTTTISSFPPKRPSTLPVKSFKTTTDNTNDRWLITEVNGTLLLGTHQSHFSSSKVSFIWGWGYHIHMPGGTLASRHLFQQHRMSRTYCSWLKKNQDRIPGRWTFRSRRRIRLDETA